MNTYTLSFDGEKYLFEIKSFGYYRTVVPVKSPSDARQMGEILQRNGYVETEA